MVEQLPRLTTMLDVLLEQTDIMVRATDLSFVSHSVARVSTSTAAGNTSIRLVILPTMIACLDRRIPRETVCSRTEALTNLRRNSEVVM